MVGVLGQVRGRLPDGALVYSQRQTRMLIMIVLMMVQEIATVKPTTSMIMMMRTTTKGIHLEFETRAYFRTRRKTQ
jgi:hypothetical protein